MHKCTHKNTKPVAHTKQVFILSDMSLLSMFLHLCVCAHTGISSVERVTNHKHTSLSLSIFFSSCLSLYFFFLLSTVDHERQTQPFLQIPTLLHRKCYIHTNSSKDTVMHCSKRFFLNLNSTDWSSAVFLLYYGYFSKSLEQFLESLWSFSCSFSAVFEICLTTFASFFGTQYRHRYLYIYRRKKNHQHDDTLSTCPWCFGCVYI